MIKVQKFIVHGHIRNLYLGTEDVALQVSGAIAILDDDLTTDWIHLSCEGKTHSNVVSVTNGVWKGQIFLIHSFDLEILKIIVKAEEGISMVETRILIIVRVRG